MKVRLLSNSPPPQKKPARQVLGDPVRSGLLKCAQTTGSERHLALLKLSLQVELSETLAGLASCRVAYILVVKSEAASTVAEQVMCRRSLRGLVADALQIARFGVRKMTSRETVAISDVADFPRFSDRSLLSSFGRCGRKRSLFAMEGKKSKRTKG